MDRYESVGRFDTGEGSSRARRARFRVGYELQKARLHADGLSMQRTSYGHPATSSGRPATALSRLRRADVTVVLPTYNEAENIERVIRAIGAHGYRMLVVDDASPDGTGELAEAMADGAQLSVLHRHSKEGLGPAYAAGFAAALEDGAAILCEMDADLSHDPGDLPRLVAAIDAGADMAIGSRYVPGGGVEDWSWFRRALSRGGNIYASMMLGAGIADMTSGFRAYRRDALQRLRPGEAEASGYGFQIELAWRARVEELAIVEVPIIFRDRTAGASKMNRAIAAEAVGLVAKWGMSRATGRLRLPPGEDR